MRYHFSLLYVMFFFIAYFSVFMELPTCSQKCPFFPRNKLRVVAYIIIIFKWVLSLKGNYALHLKSHEIRVLVSNIFLEQNRTWCKTSVVLKGKNSKSLDIVFYKSTYAAIFTSNTKRNAAWSFFVIWLLTVHQKKSTITSTINLQCHKLLGMFSLWNVLKK